jgi:cytochrome c peroxidase
MSRQRGRCLGIVLVGVALSGGLLITSSARGQSGDRPRVSAVTASNESGAARTINVTGGPVVDDGNPFFQDLGVNGRRCVTCHQPGENMSMSAAGVRARFAATGGRDPVFRTNDGSNSPLADVSTVDARRAAYSMLLRKGVIRVGLSVPADAEFELIAVQDPYGYAGRNASNNELSLFRRPLPSTNLPFLSTVMWDGRETFQRGSEASIHFDLADQANGATTGHAGAATPLDQATRDAIVEYETALFTAQIIDTRAGQLDAAGAEGGPDALSLQPFVFGGNDPLGCDANGANCNPQNAKFDPVVFTEFNAWANLSGTDRNRARAAVARGQELFNTLPIAIKNVAGINDDFKVPVVMGTCTTCHDTPHAGDHSVPAPLDIGVADPPVRSGANAFGLPVGDMPVYKLRNKTTRAVKTVTDPGRALITGKWNDIGRFKGPVLRGLAGRAPYFHNGAAATLADAVNFYDVRFDLNMTQRQKDDLVAFLRSL